MRGALSCAEQLLCSAAQDPASQTAPTIRRIIIFLPLLELNRSTGLDEFPIFGLASLVAFPGNRHWPREIRTFAAQLPRPFHISDKRYIRLAGQLFGLDFLQLRFWLVIGTTYQELASPGRIPLDREWRIIGSQTLPILDIRFRWNPASTKNGMAWRRLL